MMSETPDQILEAIASGLKHDHEIDAIVIEGDTEELDEIVIRISDYTALGVMLSSVDAKLDLYKFIALNETDLVTQIQDTGFERTIYWCHTYDLANPHDFEHVINLIINTVASNKVWPHTREAKA